MRDAFLGLENSYLYVLLVFLSHPTSERIFT